MNKASRIGNWSIKCIHFSIQRSSQKHTTATGASTVCTSQICVVPRDIPRAGIATEASNVHKSPFCANPRKTCHHRKCVRFCQSLRGQSRPHGGYERNPSESQRRRRTCRRCRPSTSQNKHTQERKQQEYSSVFILPPEYPQGHPRRGQRMPSP